MSKFSWLAIVALLSAFVIIGCNASVEVDADESGVSTDTDVDGEEHEEGDNDGDDHDGDDDDSASADTGMELASNASVDEDGDPICPVRGDKVGDITKLEPQEYEGKTYYFC